MTKTGKRVLLVIVVVLGVALAVGVATRFLRPDRPLVREVLRAHCASVVEVAVPPGDPSDEWQVVVRTFDNDDAFESESWVVTLPRTDAVRLLIEGLDNDVLQDTPGLSREPGERCRLLFKIRIGQWKRDGSIVNSESRRTRSVFVPGTHFSIWSWRRDIQNRDPDMIHVLTSCTATRQEGEEVAWTHRLYLRKAGAGPAAGD